MLFVLSLSVILAYIYIYESKKQQSIHRKWLIIINQNNQKKSSCKLITWLTIVNCTNHLWPSDAIYMIPQHVILWYFNITRTYSIFPYILIIHYICPWTLRSLKNLSNHIPRSRWTENNWPWKYYLLFYEIDIAWYS